MPLLLIHRAARWVRRAVRGSAAFAALGGYGSLAVLCTWPLPLHLGSRLTGPPGNDTGVYVWNIWLFRHEIVTEHRFPFFTNEILSLSPSVDLSLHNYTTFANVLAFPLIPAFGVTATFNLLYLTMIALTGWTMFLLARSVTGRAAESWLAGALFTASPVLIARGTAHFSLVAAMPLPVFAWCVIQADRTRQLRYAAAAGAAIAWAALCDAYFGVYCLLFGLVYCTATHVRVSKRGAWFTRRPTVRVLDALALCIAGLIAGILITGGMSVEVAGRSIAMRTLYNPVFALTLIILIRAVLALRPRISLVGNARLARIAALVATAALACVLPLSPVLYALTVRLSDGGTLQDPILWRTSPSGVDLLALFAPNPNHALFGAPWRDWLTGVPGGFAENVASIPIVALAVILLAAWRLEFRPAREWVILTGVFVLLALGPFVRVAGFNTYVPGPWALLRYVPLIGAARAPARFTIMMMLGLSVVFALALVHVVQRYPARRRVLLATIAALLLFEVVPAPRRLYSAEIPAVYSIIANDPRDVRVLELPFGVRDGESSIGDFSAAAQFHQTLHGKKMIGGYLSRISRGQKGRLRRFLVLRSLIRRSEGKGAATTRPEIHRARGRAFARRARLGYVVIDTSRATRELVEYAKLAFDLELIARSGSHELYRPRE